MKFGDVVIYKEFGREYPALVVGSRELEHHAGENEEPLVNLVFVREVKDGANNVVNVSGSSREAEAVQFRHDVAHESHSFSEEAQKDLSDKGLLPPGGAVPGGRYVEALYAPKFTIVLPGGGSAHVGIAPAGEPAVASTEGEALTGDGGNQAASSPAAPSTASDPAADQSEASGDEAAPEKEPTVQ